MVILVVMDVGTFVACTSLPTLNCSVVMETCRCGMV